MDKTEKLFVYGKLKPGFDKPASKGKPKKAIVSGDLYALKNDAAAKKIGKSNSTIMGYVLNVTPEELKRIDKEEMPQYKRIKIKTHNNESVWAYEYKKVIPKDSKKESDYKGKK